MEDKGEKRSGPIRSENLLLIVPTTGQLYDRKNIYNKIE